VFLRVFEIEIILLTKLKLTKRLMTSRDTL